MTTIKRITVIQKNGHASLFVAKTNNPALWVSRSKKITQRNIRSIYIKDINTPQP